METKRKGCKRRLRADILVFAVVSLFAFMGLATVATIFISRLPQTVREFDGSRPLINGYELWLLHGAPREILLGDSTGPTTVPSNWSARRHEVGQYAVAGNDIVGALEPFWGAQSGIATTRHFILNTSTHQLYEFETETEWRSALKQSGIDVHTLEWEY